MRVPGRLAGTMPPSASMCCGIPQPQQNPPQPDKRGERSSSMIACPFWLQLKAGLFSRSSLSKHASQHAWRAAVCPEVTCSRVVRAFNHAVRPQRIPHPRQGVQCVLARRTSGCPSRCCQTPASCCARTLTSRRATRLARCRPRFCWRSQHSLVSLSGSACCGCIVIAP